MKKSLPSFLAGVLVTVIAISCVPALANTITARTTIEVDPINVMVNGEVFAPTDVNGNPVPVFAYEGTTYAPIRALAEAYGLEVGYDADANMATVTNPSKALNSMAQSENPSFLLPENDYSDWSAEEETEYQEFKGLWTIETIGPETEIFEIGNMSYINLRCNNNKAEVDKFLQGHTTNTIKKLCARFDIELYKQYHRPEIRYCFSYKGLWGWADFLFENGWSYGYDT